MKVLIQLLVILSTSLLAACSKPSYFGQAYSPTQDVDIYLERADVKRNYITIGSTKVAKGFGSIDAAQQKVIELGKSKGADGVIMNLTEEVVSTQQNGTAVASKTKKEKVIATNSSSTTDIRQKSIVATFIRYE